MKINEKRLKIGDLIEGYYEDDSTSKVTAWGGKLDVRPEYQREFVYAEKQRDAVINTVLNGFPLNIMYFVDRLDGTYEVLDGQQRIISICRYAKNMFSVKIPAATGGYNTVNYPNLFDDQLEDFLNYELHVYVCEGTEREKLDWFQVINIAGMTLENQEILNAVLHSAWLTDAKSAFSRRNCAANKNYGKYMNGDYIRQKFLETAFRWNAYYEGITGKDAIVQYMQKHRQDKNADALWKYFEDVFAWVQATFGSYDKSMKGVEWGYLYNEHKDDNLDPVELQQRMKELMADDEVQKKSGIYEYLLTGEKKVLNLRTFSERDKITMYNRQQGLCAICGKPFSMKEMHADHIKPWSKGGLTDLSNGQMLCVNCNLAKSDK